MLLTLSGRSFIKVQYTSFSVIPLGVPLPHSNAFQYYVKREKCTVNDVIFPSGCEARAINLGNKNVEIGIFTGGTSVRSKNIFTDSSRYPSGKHEVKDIIYLDLLILICMREKHDKLIFFRYLNWEFQVLLQRVFKLHNSCFNANIYTKMVHFKVRFISISALFFCKAFFVNTIKCGFNPFLHNGTF